jgi:hypothetical protein
VRGELLPVWPETWREVWSKLANHANAPDDIFSELYRELAQAFLVAPSAEALADVVSTPTGARRAFRRVNSLQPEGEHALVEFLERAHMVVVDLGGDPLANRYFELIATFLAKFSLRYDLRRPFTLHPTLPGVFASMIAGLRAVARSDAHLNQLMLDFEDAVRDLRRDNAPNRIKTCIQKQVNLLEAIGRLNPTVNGDSLGKICDQLSAMPNPVWPHDKVRDAMKDLYRFACDYPGIRHGGTPANARRNIEMRDMVAISILLAGFTPYLSHQMDSNIAYGG